MVEEVDQRQVGSTSKQASLSLFHSTIASYLYAYPSFSEQKDTRTKPGRITLQIMFIQKWGASRETCTLYVSKASTPRKLS